MGEENPACVNRPAYNSQVSTNNFRVRTIQKPLIGVARKAEVDLVGFCLLQLAVIKES